MKKQIWKYELQVNANLYPKSISMPKNADVLSVQVQNGIVCLWALVDPLAEKEPRSFEVFGTGHEIHYDMGVERRFVATFQLLNEGLVFHVFERIN